MLNLDSKHTTVRARVVEVLDIGAYILYVGIYAKRKAQHINEPTNERTLILQIQVLHAVLCENLSDLTPNIQ